MYSLQHNTDSIPHRALDSTKYSILQGYESYKTIQTWIITPVDTGSWQKTTHATNQLHKFKEAWKIPCPVWYSTAYIMTFKA
jgi:hypothetical protein